jgi:hypothetical protein
MRTGYGNVGLFLTLGSHVGGAEGIQTAVHLAMDSSNRPHS